jgi:DNA helicase-2/ATP-dependent DNA helicase PcrA
VTAHLNPEQERAVTHGEGPLLVIAGPGSGKTRVVTQRIVHLIRDGVEPGQPVPPSRILALTFTDKAAGEMQRRVREALPGLADLPFITTFHAFCYGVLRAQHFERPLLDEVDLWIFLRRRLELLGLERYRKLAEPGAFLHDLNQFFSRCQDELVDPDQFDAYVRRSERALSDSALSPQDEVFAREELERRRELARVFRRSRALMEQEGCSSLGSLVSEAVQLFDRRPEVLDAWQKRFRFVLVDEFQDTNYAQVELLRRLTPPPHNIMAVGDDDQAIYRFRGASHGAFEMFGRAFPHHQVVHLNRNYRSTKRILRVATCVIVRNNRYQAKPRLWTDQDEGSSVFLLQSRDYESEAAWVADEIERLTSPPPRGGAEESSPFAFRDIAVLYRSHHYRDLLVSALQRKGIPFTVRGLSVLSTPIVRDLVAYLHVLHSPHDSISLTRVLLAPRWRFPEELAWDLRRQAARDRCSLFEALAARERMLLGQELMNTGWPELRQWLEGLRAAARKVPVTRLFDLLVEQLGLRFLPSDRDRIYLEAFRTFLEQWEAKQAGYGFLLSSPPSSGPQPGTASPSPELALHEDRRRSLTLQSFIEYFASFREAGGQIEVPEPESANAVQLMTVHAAKGLEFPVVFILSVARQRFPHREERPVIEFPAELRRGPAPPPDIHLQEERRLFYVAMTRARLRLYISSVAPSGRGGGRESVFIDDLLRDPAVAACDVERIQVPPLAQGEARTAASCRTPLSSREAPRLQPGDQGSLFDAQPVLHSRPDITGWAFRPLAEADALPLERPAAGGPGRLRLSASMIETYRECPMKFKLAYCYRIPTAAQATLTFGNLMHQCVRRYFELLRTGIPTFEQLRDFYLSAWTPVGFEDDYQEQMYKHAGLEQLRAFVARQNTEFAGSKRAELVAAMEFERAFRLDLGDVVLCGRIDQIAPCSAGPANQESVTPGATQEAGRRPVTLVDYKTGRPRSAQEAEKSLQLSVYALAARRELFLDPVRVTFYNLTTNESVAAVRTSQQLERACREIHEVADRIRRQEFNPLPGFACKRCEFVPLCPAHEREI